MLEPINLYEDIDLKALSDWYRAFFGVNLCTSCPQEVRKAVFKFNKMAKEKAAEPKLSMRFKAEHAEKQISTKEGVINALNLTEERIELLKSYGLGDYLEANEG